MVDQFSGSSPARRFIDVMTTVPLLGRLFIEVRYDPLSPWFLEDRPQGDRHLVVLLYGSFRRSGVMLRAAFLILRSWWKHPLEPEIVSNGSRLVSDSLGATSKPVLWMASVGIAGVVGSDFATSRYSVVSSEQLVAWIFVAVGAALCVAAYHWWKFLERLRRVLVTWVADCAAKSNLDLRANDIALFGYTFGENFRRRFNVEGVRFLAILSFCAALFITYGIGRH